MLHDTICDCDDGSDEPEGLCPPRERTGEKEGEKKQQGLVNDDRMERIKMRIQKGE